MSDIAALVAGHLDIWTSATQRKSGAGRGGGKRISLYGIERLRALILDLAVRGKLVPQDKGDEPTQKLFRQICLSKDQSLPKARFNIPAAWRWVKLGQIATCKPGRTPSRKDSRFWGGDHSWVSIADMEDSGTLVQTAETISDLAANSVFRNDPSPAGSILMSFKLTIGKISRLGTAAYHNEAIVTVSPSIADLDPFLFLMLPSCARAGVSRNAIKGATLNSKSIFEISIPLPPLAEQRRIVAKVDELMALCDALERESADAMAAHQALVEELLATLVNSPDATDLAANWARLETHFDTLFTTDASIEALKQTILDLAVRGKLVEQDAGDEAANVLLKQLKSDQSWVAGKGRGGKPKAIAPILDGSEPYELPIGWRWVRVADVFQVTSGGTIEASLEKDEGAFPYLKVADMNLLSNDVFIKTSSRFIDPDEKQMRALIRPNSIIFPKRGGAIATNKKRMVKSGIFVDLNIMAITVPEKFSLKYVYFWLQGIDLALLNTGTSVPQINHQDIDPLAFPIPPLAEQHRIVAKVDALMALCDHLKIRLGDAAQTQRHLADAITERAAA